MSYKERAKERGEQVETTDVYLPCSVCGNSTKGTELAMFGARCGPCYGQYRSQRPEKRPQRDFLDKPAAQALANISEAATRRPLSPAQLWVKECCERMVG